MKKTFRHGQILNLIRTQNIRTQEDLASALKKLGTDVTQVTLSRDIRELGLVKTANGYHAGQADAPTQPELNMLKWTLEEFVQDVNVACNLVIIRTAPGNAQTVGVALDREDWPEIVGTIAGDDTVFAATPDPKQAAKARAKLLALLK